MKDQDLIEQALVVAGGRVKNLAAMTGVSTVTIWKWCARAENPSGQKLTRFARATLMDVVQRAQAQALERA